MEVLRNSFNYLKTLSLWVILYLSIYSLLVSAISLDLHWFIFAWAHSLTESLQLHKADISSEMFFFMNIKPSINLASLFSAPNHSP